MKDRKVYIDAIKIISIIFVIFNHTGATGFLAYENQTRAWLQILELGVSCLCKTAVPLFFMCSGALLLEKEKNIIELWKRKILKYFIVTIFFTLLYYVFLSWKDGGSINLNWILRFMYENQTFSYSGSYWFLYSYIGFLMMLPLLRVMAINMTSEVFWYILILNTLFTGFLPIFQYFTQIGNLAISIPIITEQAILYPLVGHYVNKHIEQIGNKDQKIFVMMSIVSMFLSIVLSLNSLIRGNATQSYFGLFQLYLVIFIFGLAYRMFANYNGALKRIFIEIGNCSFGIYLIHGFVFTILEDEGVLEIHNAGLNTVIVFIISLFIAGILRKVPILKMLL